MVPAAQRMFNKIRITMFLKLYFFLTQGQECFNQHLWQVTKNSYAY